MLFWDVIFHQGPLFAPKHDESPIPGRVFVVTGGLSGLGLHTTLNLALRGARVYVGVRTPSKAKAELSKLEALHPTIAGKVIIFEVDLASIEGTREGARKVLAVTDRLDGLVNNAGRLADASDYELSADGIEMLAQVNHFGTFVFTQTLLPVLEKTSKLAGSDVRIITVGSNAQNMVPTTFEVKDESSFNETLAGSPAKKNSSWAKFSRYAVSKAYNSMFASELQRRLDEHDSNIISLSVHPGGVATEKVLNAKGAAGAFLGIMARLFFLTPSQGAYTSIFALTSPEVRAQSEKYKGVYLVPFGNPAQVAPFVANEGQRRLLWSVTEKVVEEGGLSKV